LLTNEVADINLASFSFDYSKCIICKRAESCSFSMSIPVLSSYSKLELHRIQVI